jgi:hypothetical protein
LRISHIVPLGEVQTRHDFTPHTDIVNKDTSPVPVLASVDVEVYNVVHNGTDYAIQARASCDHCIELAHITDPIPQLVSAAQAFHEEMDPDADDASEADRLVHRFWAWNTWIVMSCGTVRC